MSAETNDSAALIELYRNQLMPFGGFTDEEIAAIMSHTEGLINLGAVVFVLPVLLSLGFTISQLAQLGNHPHAQDILYTLNDHAYDLLSVFSHEVIVEMAARDDGLEVIGATVEDIWNEDEDDNNSPEPQSPSFEYSPS